MASLEHFQEKHKKILVVNWVFGNRCNYRCSYCPKDLHDGSEARFFDPSAFPLVRDFCLKLLEQKSAPQVCFLFAGGEFTLYSEFFPLLSLLKSQCARVALVSNASRPLNFWEKAKALLDHVSLSFHPEFADPEHFKKVVSTLTGSAGVHVNVMVRPHGLEQAQGFAQELAQLPWPPTVSLQPLLINLGDTLYPYSALELQKLAEVVPALHQTLDNIYSYRGDMKRNGQSEPIPASEMISSGLNSWTGLWCYAGVENIVVDVDGDIYRSWCFAQENHPAPEEGYLGNIFAQDWQLPSHPVRCKKSRCHCTLDIMCTKVAHV